MIINPQVSQWSDGIIGYLNTEYKESLYDYIQIFPDSTSNEAMRDGAYVLINTTYQTLTNVDPMKRNWCSYNKSNSFFILKFPKFQVSPTLYAFQSRDFDDHFYPKTWYVQGSKNKIDWVNISVMTGDNAMEKNQQLFIPFQNGGIFKYLKFIQIEATNSFIFCLQRIELYGLILFQTPSFEKQCIFSNYRFFLILAVMYIILIN